MTELTIKEQAVLRLLERHANDPHPLTRPQAQKCVNRLERAARDSTWHQRALKNLSQGKHTRKQAVKK